MSEQHGSPGSPGSHPHADRPNWRPGDDDAADELLIQKIFDALRDGKSERHIAKLLGVSRMLLGRGHLWNKIPSPLWERLVAARVSQKERLTIARLFRGDEDIPHELECCPNCGHVLRDRNGLKPATIAVLRQWRAEGAPEGAPETPRSSL